MKIQYLLSAMLILLMQSTLSAQNSVAREWNEVVLQSIRNDYARPTVHARNLFHTSVAMYDVWAAYDDQSQTYLLGNVIGAFDSDFEGVDIPFDVEAARNEAISYAVYRIIQHRYKKSPLVENTRRMADSLMLALGYDTSYISDNYKNGNPAAFGNYTAKEIIEFGLQDGSNEANDYENQYYEVFNPPLVPEDRGNPNIIDFNRWQPLSLGEYIDQSGNVISGDTIPFLSPEWGRVQPFSLTPNNLSKKNRDGQEYWIYHDPGKPAYIQADGGGDSDLYKWNFSLVSIWSSHLDPDDSTLLDISPATIGNVQSYPQSMIELEGFYDLFEGGDIGEGYPKNPITNAPYVPQIVKRGDYTRVLAEFWADGPDSETPPGHWFTILNYVHDQPLFNRRYKGEGAILDDLEWDVKAYLTLGGAMHDCAISAWGIKGYYDYVRPVSAIRAMAEKGQSSDTSAPNYSQMGIELIPGYIEQVDSFEALTGTNFENLGEIKLKAWRGPRFLPALPNAGVSWILADYWMPYQRPTFVTPPFAGYVSGHSTYSRAAAEVLTMLTGDEYFPGGMGEFLAQKDSFLVFEQGPSEDVKLQWAKYKDASDQCSMSRIWGGIHPPLDDIPGRIIGEKIGIQAFNLADQLFNGVTAVDAQELDNIADIYPNPITTDQSLKVQLSRDKLIDAVLVYNLTGQRIDIPSFKQSGRKIDLKLQDLTPGSYLLKLSEPDGNFFVAPFYVN